MRRGFVLLCLLTWPVRAVCGSPVPVELYAEVDHALRPAVVLADPVAYRGRTLLLGGFVNRTISEAGRVTVELDGYQLDDSDRPLAADPALGRLVTLVGEVAGRSEGDGATLPQLEVRFIHPWPTAEEEAASRQPACTPGCYYDPWCDPWWHDPWCDPWYYGPYPRWRFGGGYYRHWH